jgi:hypothetical protein
VCVDSAGVGLGSESRGNGYLAWLAAFLTVGTCILAFYSLVVNTQMVYPRCRRIRVAYRRAFFLGPGRPRTRATGSVWPLVRLVPGLGPGIPFRRGVSPGVAPVAGVEFASAFDSASAEDGRAAGASVEEAGEDCSVALSGLDVGSGVLVSGESGVSSINCRKALGASLRVTSSVVGAFFAAPARLERPLGVEPAGMVGVERTWNKERGVDS